MNIKEDKDSKADLYGNYDFELEYPVVSRNVQTWKEFFITYRTEFVHKERGVTSVKLFHNWVRPTTYYGTSLGFYQVSDSKLGIKDQKIYAYVDHRKWVTKKSESVTQEKISLKFSGNIFDVLKERLGISSSDNSNTEVDVREYKLVNGEYIDQFGVPILEHVLDITQEPNDEIQNTLLIPLSEDATESVVYVIKNPIFSGKRVHPPTFLFEEKYNLDLKWGGIGLGEFSHSVNLFPGERREMEIITTKKKSIEISSKSEDVSKKDRSSTASTSSKRNDSLSNKLNEAFENSDQFQSSKSKKRSKKSSVSAEVGGGFGPFSASASASSASQSSSSSSQSASLSSVAKNALELTRETSSEVSENNKVSFTSSSESRRTLEQKMNAEDSESEKTSITIENRNEGRTINYNFFQVTNIYETELAIENVRLHISTGIEIIPGTGLTVGKSYDLEDFAEIERDLKILSKQDRAELIKAIAAQVLLRYAKIDGTGSDEPRILEVQNLTQSRLKELAEVASGYQLDETKFVMTDLQKSEDELKAENEEVFLQSFPDELLEMKKAKFINNRIVLESKDSFVVNSGKYYVDAQVGNKPAAEVYWQARRDLETKKLAAEIEHTKEKTRKGVFFPELPKSLQELSLGRDLESLSSEEKNG